MTVKGREIGMFNVDGDYFALANRCPHAGGPLCSGRIVALVHVRRTRPLPPRAPSGIPALPVARLGVRHPHRPVLVRSELDPGAAVCQVTVEPGAELVKGPYVAETFPVSVEEDYLVIELAG